MDGNIIYVFFNGFYGFVVGFDMFWPIKNAACVAHHLSIQDAYGASILAVVAGTVEGVGVSQLVNGGHHQKPQKSAEDWLWWDNDMQIDGTLVSW